MNTRIIVAALFLAVGLVPAEAPAQTYTENFTGTTTTNSWTFITGACLTAGTAASDNPASPACGGLPGFGLAYYNTSPLPEFGGTTGVLPDAVNTGALRFTDWYAQTGAILSNFNYAPGAQGLQVTFTTVTYEGDSGGGGGDGADGMSFFLQDATYPPDVGAFGGSLAYTCSNVNFNGTLRGTGIPRGYDGLQGGYIGLGIDEYGNFLNQGDNTATGYGYVPGRIGMRGPGSTTWAWLNANYPLQYPSSLTNAQGAAAVQQSCRTGHVWDYSNPATPVDTGITLSDYAIIPGAFSLLPNNRKIANEAATTRAQAIPIVYNLKITPAGLLSFQYSYNGGALQNVITNQDITAGGTVPIPANVRFGFAGSTGGSRNIHEIMCFQAFPASVSQSSGGVNQKQTAKVQTGTQVYFAYYDPTTLAGSLTSQYVGQPVGDPNPNDLVISSVVNWDGSCVLTGLAAGQTCDATGPTGPVPAEGPASRTMLTWNGATGVPFQWASLSTTWPTAAANEQVNLDTGDAANPTPPPFNYSRLNYLRGDRSNEQTPTSSTTFVGTFRDRASVLGDIIDSSPTWVGPPNGPYPNVWADKYAPDAASDPMAENSGQTYANFASAAGMQNRTNIVYAGANDGFLHGFRSGYYSTPNTYQPATNDGWEVMAYMPGYIVNTIQTLAAASNYSDPQYGHHFDVDAAPGTGDLFYAGQWHTWLVGGLGAGGNAIYALDVTNPGLNGANGFSEGAASTTVIGEWSLLNGVTNLSCANDASPMNPCGNNLGKTYGTPQIRRFHNGSWGAVFGNGNPELERRRRHLRDARESDRRRCHVLLSQHLHRLGRHAQRDLFRHPRGSRWRSHHRLRLCRRLARQRLALRPHQLQPRQLGSNECRGTSTVANGGAPTPLFTTMAGQPITTQLVVASVAGSVNPRVLVEFGTGKQTPMTNTSASTYATTQQALYGIWDWNLTAWNANSGTQYTSLPGGGVSAPATPLAGTASLVQQTIGGPYTATVAGTGTDYRTLSSLPICWADATACGQFGWYINLASGNANAADPADPTSPATPVPPNPPVIYEQVTYSPVLEAGAFIVNTTIPGVSVATMCYAAGAFGWTMAVNPATGGAFTNSFFGTPTHNFLNVTTTQTNGSTTTSTILPVSGIALGGTGSVSVVVGGTQSYLVTQTVSGTGAIESINPPGGTKGSRLTWIQRR